MRLFRITFGLALAIIASAQLEHQGLTVHTKQGDVVGMQVSPGVRRFLGIPFAVAQRWEAPQSPPSRDKPFVASDFGHSCPQLITPGLLAFFDTVGSFFGEHPITESEDCLSVNIWSPSIKRKQKTAVMIWVYGGSFLSGTSDSPFYDGQTLVQNHDDVTVVTFNYRLNILGQPNAPQLYNQSSSQNFGLLDVDAAIQWVYENIAEFGGDPERITLFGESAGAVTIDAYTFAHPEDKRVKGVIQQSGNLGLPVTGAVNSTFDPTNWNTVTNSLNCGNVSGTEQLDCLKGVNYTNLIETVVKNNLSFFPVADGITIFADTRARAEAGNFLRVPLLSGTTAHEEDIFVVAGQLLAQGYAIPVLTELLSDLLTQITFACPAAQTASDRVKAGVSSWRYIYEGIFRDISSRPDLRAYHSSEIPIVFGNFGNGTEEIPLSKYIQGAWVAFARDPADGLGRYGWPLYNPDTASLAQLGGFYNKTGVTFAKGKIVDFTCNATDTLDTVLGQLLPLLGPAAGSII